MELKENFLPAALQVPNSDGTLAGVAGLVEEQNAGNLQYRRRKAKSLEDTPCDVAWLGMGRLYRRSTVESVGHTSNLNLFAHEEQEPGLRLTADKWRLTRLYVDSVHHYGHSESGLALLRKRWRSVYLSGSGQVLSAGFGTSYFVCFALEPRHLLFTLGLYSVLVTGLATPSVSIVGLLLWLALIALRVVARIIRHERIADSLLCVVVWHVTTLAMLHGLFLRQTDPREPLLYNVITDDAKTANNRPASLQSLVI